MQSEDREIRGGLGGPIKGSVGEGGSYLREGTLGENTMRLVRSLNGKKTDRRGRRLEMIDVKVLT